MSGIFRSMTGAILLALFLLAGCETTRGIGKDMQRAGRWIERETNK